MYIKTYEEGDLTVEVFPDGQYRFIKSVTDYEGDPAKVVLAFDSRNFLARVVDTEKRLESIDTNLETLLHKPEDWRPWHAEEYQKAIDLYNEAVKLLERYRIEIPEEPTGCPEELVELYSALVEREKVTLDEVEPESYVAIIKDHPFEYEKIIDVVEAKSLMVSRKTLGWEPFVRGYCFLYNPQTGAYKHFEGDLNRRDLIQAETKVPITEDEVEIFRRHLSIEMDEDMEKPFYEVLTIKMDSYVRKTSIPVEERLTRAIEFVRCAEKKSSTPAEKCRGYGTALSFIIDNKELLTEDFYFLTRTGSGDEKYYALWDKIERNSTPSGQGRGVIRAGKEEDEL